MFRATHGTRLISPVPGAALGTCNIAIIIQRVPLKKFYVPTHPPHMNYMSWAGAQLNRKSCGMHRTAEMRRNHVIYGLRVQGAIAKCTSMLK